MTQRPSFGSLGVSLQTLGSKPDGQGKVRKCCVIEKLSSVTRAALSQKVAPDYTVTRPNIRLSR
jgi:hypothetical protein